MQNKVERVAGATDMMQDTLDSQTKPLVDSIRDNMAEIMKEMIILSLAYTEKSEFDNVLGPDNLLKNVDLQSIVRDYDFDFQIESNKKKKDTTER